MVDRIRALRAWVLRRAGLLVPPFVLSGAAGAYVFASDAYPLWLKAILLPMLGLAAAVLAAELADVAARIRRRPTRFRRRVRMEWAHLGVAGLLILLVVVVPPLLVGPRPVSESAAPIVFAPPPPHEDQAASTPPHVLDALTGLQGPLDAGAIAALPAEPPPPLPPSPPSPPAVVATDVPSSNPPPYADLESLRFRPDFDGPRPQAISWDAASRRPAVLPSLRIEMTLFLEEAEDPEGSGLVAELAYPIGPDEGLRAFIQTSADAEEESLFDDGPTWAWRRLRLDYVRRLPLGSPGIVPDIRFSAGLAYDRFMLSEEIGLSDARGGAPVLGVDLALLREGPVRIHLHAAYTPAVEDVGHGAAVTEIGATAFIRLSDSLFLTVGWRYLKIRLEEVDDGLAQGWDDTVTGPAIGFEFRL